ncbi:MAG: 3-isopropylmalate dehydratase small subunit [Proteobacteria bacterium]|nr:3-isopropylmalate dehydratase small subunit [Pseudomonadota bacterium]
MDKFTTLTAPAAPLMMENVDTDLIIPKQFLKTIKRTGLGKNLFNDLRYTQDGQEIGNFVLNKPAYRKAGILLAGQNFGCGSSREHAPWSLLDFGIRCVIAPSFADIFYGNCFKNGILPLTLPMAAIEQLAAVADTTPVTVDLKNQTVKAGNLSFTFDIEPFRKTVLLEGLDDIGQTLQKTKAIDGFEAKQSTTQPWLYQEGK